MSNGSKEIEKDTAAAKHGVIPPVLTDTYGSRPPQAAVFDQGVSDRAGAQEAQDARRNARPGNYDSAKR
jgi:hypothetical protein